MSKNPIDVSEGKRKTIEEVLAPYILTDTTLKKIRDVFESEMDLGLSKNPSKKSSLQMENTFIPQLCTGEEIGEFLALDLGGTNFRVILLKLDTIKGIDEIIKYYNVPEELRLGTGEKLFDFLAACIYDFMKFHNLLEKSLSLGFCFSFPMVQRGINSGILVTWTKSFNCPDVVGKDAVDLLSRAIKKRGDIQVDVSAVVNDTTGTLLNGAYLQRDCRIGLVLGTGCNACYVESIDKVEKWKGIHSGINEVIIDTEWGAFGDNGVLDFFKTDCDALVDNQSLLPHSFTFEKLYAGKFLGELVRFILLKLISKNALFDGKRPKSLENENSFTAANVSDILGENPDHIKTKEIFSFLGIEITEEDAEIIKHVCDITTRRGAMLVSVCLASLLDRMNKGFASIAVDGSLFRSHPTLETYMRKYISSFTNKAFDLFLVQDGSGIGAGLVAAVVKQLDTSQLHE